MLYLGIPGGGVWLVDIVVNPIGLQTSSALSVPFLTHPLETRHSVQWLAVSIQLCISKDLAGLSEETAISGSFQEAFLSIHNSVGVW